MRLGTVHTHGVTIARKASDQGAHSGPHAIPVSVTKGMPIFASDAKFFESVVLRAKGAVALKRATASLLDGKAHRRLWMNLTPDL